MKDFFAILGVFYTILTIGIFLMSWIMSRKPKKKPMAEYIVDEVPNILKRQLP